MKARGPFGWPLSILPTWLGGTGVTRVPANHVFAGPTSGGDEAPSFRALTASDVPSVDFLGFKNIAGRNGGLEVWQRGAGGSASIAVAASSLVYTADGWALLTGANQASVVSQQAGLTSQSRYCARIQRNSGQTGTGGMAFEFPLDADEAAMLSGNIVTLSFTARAGANWSPSGGTLTVGLYNGTGSPAKRSSGAYTNDANALGTGIALTTSPVRYTFTSALALQASVRQASVYFSWTPVGTAGAADYFEIDDVQLEVAASATTFERPPFSYEFQRCLRHFQKTFAYASVPAQNVGSFAGAAAGFIGQAAAGAEFIWWFMPVRMRADPTVTTFNPAAANAQVRNANAPGDHSATAATGSETEVLVQSTGNAAGVVGQRMHVHLTADAGI